MGKGGTEKLSSGSSDDQFANEWRKTFLIRISSVGKSKRRHKNEEVCSLFL